MGKKKETPSWLKALGKEDPPPEVEIPSGKYRRTRIVKHDFFAATAFYEDAAGSGDKIVLKIGRRKSLFGIPMGWIGRLHAWHESRVFRQLDSLELVPAFTGLYGKHGFTHRFVEGHDLAKGERVPDDFFERLRAGLAEIHAHGMAYVDLEKTGNILVGDDGKPHLFDFQIAWYWPARWGGERWPLRWIRDRLQQADRYHVLKHQRRTRPDQMTEEELARSRHRPFYIRVHNKLTRPFTRVRRRLLNRIDPVRKSGERGRIHSTSDAEG